MPTRDVRDNREMRDTREMRDNREMRDTREMRDNREVENRDMRETREARNDYDIRSERPTSSISYQYTPLRSPSPPLRKVEEPTPSTYMIPDSLSQLKQSQSRSELRSPAIQPNMSKPAFDD